MRTSRRFGINARPTLPTASNAADQPQRRARSALSRRSLALALQVKGPGKRALLFDRFEYQAKSWPRPRQIIYKAEITQGKANPRFDQYPQPKCEAVSNCSHDMRLSAAVAPRKLI